MRTLCEKCWNEVERQVTDLEEELRSCKNMVDAVLVFGQFKQNVYRKKWRK